VRRLARRAGGAAVATGDRATSARCLQLLGSSHVAHIACHGTFRADNPLFSTLRLADGPVNVYDLERSAGMARTVVLSACSAGASTAMQGDTLLGLAGALMAFGASSIIAPLSPVNDEHVLDAMVRLHEGLRAGLEPSAALARVRVDGAPGDPTAGAFVVIGA
jgi:CHAT domain-containing protein